MRNKARIINNARVRKLQTRSNYRLPFLAAAKYNASFCQIRISTVQLKKMNRARNPETPSARSPSY